MEYSSKSVGTAGLTTGIIGTALGVLNGGASMLGGNILGGGTNNTYVNRYELDMQMGYEKQLAEQNVKIASLEAERISNDRDVEVYKQVRTDIGAVRDALSARIGACESAINAQAVYNATNTATIGCLQNQIAQLQSMTKLYIPSTNVSPQPMNLYNSWTAPTTTTTNTQ